MFSVGKIAHKDGRDRRLTEAEINALLEECQFKCDDESWKTSCGVEFYFDRDPETMGFKYCPNCGGEIKQKGNWIW